MKLNLIIFVLLVFALVSTANNVLRRQRRFLDRISHHRLPERFPEYEESSEPHGEFFSNVDPLSAYFNAEASRTYRRIHDEMKSFLSESLEREREGPGRSEEEKTGEKETGEKEFDPSVVIVDTTDKLDPEDPFDSLDTPHKNFFLWFGLRGSWWNGPHVCVEKEEVDEESAENVTSMSLSIPLGYLHATGCKETETSYICTTRIKNSKINKSYVVKKQCCHGYKKDDSVQRCVQSNLKDLVQTMEDLNVQKFLSLAKSTGFIEKFKSGNFTIFCPTDEAVLDFEEDSEDNEIPQGRVVRSADLANVVGGHITNGYLKTGDMTDEETIETLNGKSKIRINKYHNPERVTTANCMRLVGANNYATNGVVHLVNQMLPMPSKTVADIIQNDPQFSIFHNMLSSSDLLKRLSDPNENLTVLAPNDKAFQLLDAKILKNFQEGHGCVETVLKNHILPNVVCSTAIPLQARTINLLRNFLLVSRDEKERLYVEGVQIAATDIIGTNGVIHIIEEVLIPEDAEPVSKFLESSKLTEFLDLAEEVGLRDTFDNSKNTTFFIPSTLAMKSIPPEALSTLRQNPEVLKEIILYHIVTPKVPSCEWKNNLELNTSLPGKSLKMNMYGYIPALFDHVTVQCALVTSRDNHACGSVTHVVDRILFPPKGTVLDVLEGMDGFKILKKLIKVAGMEEYLKSQSPLTLLAPVDEAFKQVPYLSELESDEEKAQDFVKLHILTEMLCCEGVHSTPFFNKQQAHSLHGALLTYHRGIHGSVKFGSARAIKCDSVAENGVIHTINKVLQLHRSRPFSFPDPFFSLFFREGDL